MVNGRHEKTTLNWKFKLIYLKDVKDLLWSGQRTTGTLYQTIIGNFGPQKWHFFTSKWTNWWKKPHQTTPETFSETFTSLTLAAENPDQCRSGATTQAEQGPALPCAMAPTNGSKGKLRHSQQGKASTKKLCKRSSPQFWCLVFECQKIQLPTRFSCTVSTVTILV